jgi:hypothetical protein
MQIVVHRLDQARYRSIIDRDDGVRYLVGGAGATGRLPHDLIHYVVESELGLRAGFWGSVADGAVFPSMTWLDGRRRPHATERGDAVIKANGDQLTAAEILASIFAEALARELNGDEAALAGEIHRRWASRPGGGGGTVVSREAAVRICAALRDMAERWHETPIGGSLTVAWDSRLPFNRSFKGKRSG